jgi:VacB/RNase II family 3'-5' exoribonuclease
MRPTLPIEMRSADPTRRATETPRLQWADARGAHAVTANVRVVVPPTADELTAGFASARQEVDLPPAFPPDVERAAEEAAQRVTGEGYDDMTQLALITIDPPGSRDLDQAMHIARAGDGFAVTYAIADPGFFVDPGSVLDAESRARGQTIYSPDTRTPLYPLVISEDAASLLPGQSRPSVLWELSLDAGGEIKRTRVRRALVRSTEQLTYEQAQQRVDKDAADGTLPLLKVVGELREKVELARGGVHLDVPEQEVVPSADGYRLQYRVPRPVEDWNAQISLMTGMAAARLMLEAKIGLLRTLPKPDSRAVDTLRRAAKALDVDWAEGVSYQAFIRTLDGAVPAHAALLTLATTLLRGAGYVAFDGVTPEHARHSAIADHYAHATAPLRRLADRFVSEVCLAIGAGAAVPDWVRASLPDLPAIMSASDRRARALERIVLDYVEAAILAHRVGEEFEGVVVEVDDHGGVVQVTEPAVRAHVDGGGRLPLGERVRLTLIDADPRARRVAFARVRDPRKRT